MITFIPAKWHVSLGAIVSSQRVSSIIAAFVSYCIIMHIQILFNRTPCLSEAHVLALRANELCKDWHALLASVAPEGQ